MPDTKKILVVDDEEMIRKILRIHLTKAGYDVTTAADGFEALKSLDDGLPDLVITDIMMPRLDGLELGKAIRFRDETKEIPFIVISAKTDIDTVKTAKELKAVKFFGKPFKMSQLIESIRAVLGEND